VEKINTYIQEKIVFADNVLVTNAVAKVYDDDVILTYSFSSVIFNILLRAKKVGPVREELAGFMSVWPSEDGQACRAHHSCQFCSAHKIVLHV